MRLIDKEALERDFAFMVAKREAKSSGGFISDIFKMTEEFFLELLEEQPTIEAKPVEEFIKYIDNAFDDRSHGESYFRNEKDEKISADTGYAYEWWRGCMKPELERVFKKESAQMDEPISCGHEDDNHIAEDGKKGAKIPVISMEDVPKIMEEMEK